MNYYKLIKNELIDNEINKRVKDYSKNKYELEKYYNVGKLLIEAQGGLERAKYGNGLIKKYSQKLVIDVNKTYNERTLRRMRQFYTLFKNKKWSALPTKLSWSHYSELLVLDDINAINYYIDIASKRNMSYRELHDLIKKHTYERLPKSAKQKLINKEETKLPDLVPNPIMIRNKNNYEIISEKILMKIIMEDIPSFLKELGSGFTFIDKEYKIRIGNNYNYIDLLLFNYEYNCFVVIELKVTELKKEHIGQIQVYMNYIDNKLKKYYQDKTIGIIVTKKDNKFIMEYCSDPRILNREYELI